MVDTVQIPEAIKYPEYESSKFEINIVSMKAKEINGIPNVVYSVRYEIVATLASGTKRKFEGEIEYLDNYLNDIDPFTLSADLTEADVQAWIEAHIDVENIKRGLTQPEATVADHNVALPWGS